MIRIRSVRSWIALLALAGFAVPATGAHLHLCLDGTGGEPPASMHVSDVGGHYQKSGDSDHHDVDVSVDREVLVKKGSVSPDAQKYLPIAPIPSVSPVTTARDYPRGPPAPIVQSIRHWILPPLRAPPV
jgi:hypothetical protein